MLLVVVCLLGALAIGLGRGHIRVRALVARLVNLTIEITADEKRSIEEHLGGAAARKGDREEAATEIRAMLGHLQRLLACRILWVDDHPEGNRDEALALERMGHLLVQATSSEDAERVLDRGRFDIVITDITRGTDPEAGLAFIKKMRQRRLRLPIIVYSDKADDYRRQAVRVGATDVARYPSELLLRVIAHVAPGWPVVYMVREPGRLRRWLGERWRQDPRLVAAGLAVLVAATAVLSGSAVVAWRLAQPPCLAMRPGDQLRSTGGPADCAVRLGPDALTLDCTRELTIPAGRLLEESRDYDGHPTPVSGDGNVIVSQGVCTVTSPRRRVETSLRSAGPAIGDGAVVADVRPITGAAATLGMSMAGSSASRGLGVYLFIGSTGGVIAQDTGGAGLATSAQVQGGLEPNAFNRLVICLQSGQLTAWLNGRELGRTSDTAAPAGDVRLSLEDFDPTNGARLDVRQLAVFGAGGTCAG